MTTTTLRESLDRFPGGLLITDKESRVLYASSALERRTGFAVPEIVGKKPGQLWGGKMEREFYVALWKTISAKQPFVGEVHNTKKNGAKKTEHIFILPLKDETGETAYFAEIHPELGSREQEEAFGQEFLFRARHMDREQDFFSWVFERLQAKSDGTALVNQGFSFGAFQTAAQFFRETLITPMEQLFSPRKEDALLVAQAQAQPEKFSRLYEKYVTRIEEYFLRRLEGDRQLAEDLTQEVFIRAFRYLPTFRTANASYYTYLLHVAHSVLVNQYRKKEPVTSCLLKEAVAEEVVEKEPTQYGDMAALLGSLSEGERRVMLLKYQDGLKVQEIARQVGKTENAVKLILSRSRKKLKQALR
jgi:RNA polymerase sigma factor (sigma-70 family)